MHLLFLAEAPDGSGRIFIVDQSGVIYVLMPDGILRDEPLIDLRPNMVSVNSNYDERGLLGFAFHPDFAENQTVYVYYSGRLRAGAPSWIQSYGPSFRIPSSGERPYTASTRLRKR